MQLRQLRIQSGRVIVKQEKPTRWITVGGKKIPIVPPTAVEEKVSRKAIDEEIASWEIETEGTLMAERTQDHIVFKGGKRVGMLTRRHDPQKGPRSFSWGVWLEGYKPSEGGQTSYRESVGTVSTLGEARAMLAERLLQLVESAEEEG